MARRHARRLARPSRCGDLSSIAALAVVPALAAITQTRMVRRRLDTVKNDFLTALRPRFILRDVHAQLASSASRLRSPIQSATRAALTAHIVESVIAVDVEHWNGSRRVPITGGKNRVGDMRWQRVNARRSPIRWRSAL